MTKGSCAPSGMMLTDLHNHALPGMDDGAGSVDVSRQMLLMARRQGITRIAFTPHYYPEQMTPDEFLEKRQFAFNCIKDICDEEGISPKLGAEIRIRKDISELALRKLAYSGEAYALLELPDFCYPLWLEELIVKMNGSGIVPVLAHIERYDYLMSDRSCISQLRELGAVMQVNASALLSKKTFRTVKEMIRSKQVDIICSDAHNADTRPVRLAEALETLNKADRLRLIRNAECIFNGASLD